MQKKLDTKLLFDERQIKTRVLEIADQILSDYDRDNAPIICLCVLRGAVLFFGDLIKAMPSDRIILDFIRISSYGGEMESSGKVQLCEGMSEDIGGKHVLIVEDIIDSGLTVNFLRKYFAARNPLDIKVVTLLDKPMARKIDASADYTCFYLQNSSFVVGYGLDYNQAYRNLNGIFEIKN